ncbi:MAG: nicotinate phosphoribosyltransferase [Thermodesulfobacteriota bacterium]
MITTDSISPLFTDLYELTMMAGYHKKNMNKEASFSLYIRPENTRNYFVFAGLETVLNCIENLKFSFDEINYLKSLNLFEDSFLKMLENFRFTGDIHAMEEGTLFFGNEPVLEVTAPIIEAQLLETMIVNTINFETMIATKAARCVHSAGNKPLADFSLRRTHGSDAGIKTARSAYIGGFSATSNVLAGKMFNIPVSGTMAHSFVTAFKTEEEAFEAFCEAFPDQSILLIDTYDTLNGAKIAAQTGKKLASQGKQLKGVRLDSGDMADLSIKVRKILDENGLNDAKIFASSGFDEFKIEKTLNLKAAIDAFGVGTSMGVSADTPFHDTVYKLNFFNGRNVRKLSKNKITLAGKKQVFRFFDENNLIKKDIIGTREENFDNSDKLLKPVVKQGVRCKEPESVENVKNRFKKEFTKLDNKYKTLKKHVAFPVLISENLKSVQP